jgi:hypothetical protein
MEPEKQYQQNPQHHDMIIETFFKAHKRFLGQPEHLEKFIQIIGELDEELGDD